MDYLQSEITSFPSSTLFDLARNDHARPEARLIAAGELLARGDKRAQHPDVAPFAAQAAQTLQMSLFEIEAASKHEPQSPQAEDHEVDNFLTSVGAPSASVTTNTFQKTEVIDNRPKDKRK